MKKVKKLSAYSCMNLVPTVQRNTLQESLNHSAKSFVKGIAFTTGIEGFSAILRRGYYRTYRNLSTKHLNRYIDAFTFRPNEGKHGIHTLDGINAFCMQSVGKPKG